MVKRTETSLGREVMGSSTGVTIRQVQKTTTKVVILRHSVGGERGTNDALIPMASARMVARAWLSKVPKLAVNIKAAERILTRAAG